MPMRHSQPIQVNGVFLGIAVEHELGVRFIAIDALVTDMDRASGHVGPRLPVGPTIVQVRTGGVTFLSRTEERGMLVRRL